MAAPTQKRRAVPAGKKKAPAKAHSAPKKSAKSVSKRPQATTFAAVIEPIDFFPFALPTTGALLAAIGCVLLLIIGVLLSEWLWPQRAVSPDPLGAGMAIEYVASDPEPTGMTLGSTSAPAPEDASAETPVASHPPFIQSRLDITTVAAGERGGLSQAQQVLVNSEQEWNALWAKLPTAPRPLVRGIDFKRFTVIGIFGGTLPSRSSIDATHAVKVDDETRVYITRARPEARCIGDTDDAVAPFVMIAMPKIPGAVKFIGTEIPLGC